MKKFKNFGPAFLILALGIGSGELILWPYLSANYGFGILWGALLGISLQLFLINIISRNTILFNQNIIKTFSLVFSGAFLWIIFSTIIGFGWPGFSALSAELLTEGLSLQHPVFSYLAIFILSLTSFILILSKNAYKVILKIEKVAMALLFILTLFLFVFYFNLNDFIQMFKGLVGIGENYLFLPELFLVGGSLAVFVGAVAYAGSGGNLLLLNSSYVLEENKELDKKRNKKGIIKNIFKQNFIFFWSGGLLIIMMLSYISKVSLKGAEGISEDFSFLIKEAHIFMTDIHPFIGYSFIILGAMAIFGVQLGIFDFIGRLVKDAKNHSLKLKNRVSDRLSYGGAIFVAYLFGLIILLLGFDKPKSLIIVGAIINSLSMGVIAFLLLLIELKKVSKEVKSKKVIYGTIFATIFYISFFLYVLFEKVFL